MSSVAVRRLARRPSIEPSFDSTDVEAALDLLALTDLAWHDTYGEPHPPDSVLDDLLVVAQGDLERLIRFAFLAVVDWRDLRVVADKIRDQDGG